MICLGRMQSEIHKIISVTHQSYLNLHIKRSLVMCRMIIIFALLGPNHTSTNAGGNSEPAVLPKV